MTKWNGNNLSYLLQVALMVSMQTKGKDSPMKCVYNGNYFYAFEGNKKVEVLSGIKRITLKDRNAFDTGFGERFTGEEFISMLKGKYGIELTESQLIRAQKARNPLGWSKFYQKVSNDAFYKWDDLRTRWLPD